MTDALLWHRLQFGFTIVFHYLFPQLTMGLAALIAITKAIGVVRKDERWLGAARFWIRIFAVNFAFGVVTGIPMEMQFGTNWSRFTGYAGAVIGHSLGMESLFAFFLESVFLGMLVFGERRLGLRHRPILAVAVERRARDDQVRAQFDGALRSRTPRLLDVTGSIDTGLCESTYLPLSMALFRRFSNSLSRRTCASRSSVSGPGCTSGPTLQMKAALPWLTSRWRSAAPGLMPSRCARSRPPTPCG